jgi:hypothetical protein
LRADTWTALGLGCTIVLLAAVLGCSAAVRVHRREYAAPSSKRCC